MYVHGKEVRPNSLRKAFHTGLLRLFGMNNGFEQHSHAHEAISQVSVSGSNYHNCGEEIGTVLLDAERRKAETLMEWQRRPFIC